MDAVVQRVHFQDALVHFKTHFWNKMYLHLCTVSLNVNRLSWAHLHPKAPVKLNKDLTIPGIKQSSIFFSSEKNPNLLFVKVTPACFRNQHLVCSLSSHFSPLMQSVLMLTLYFSNLPSGHLHVYMHWASALWLAGSWLAIYVVNKWTYHIIKWHVSKFSCGQLSVIFIIVSVCRVFQSDVNCKWKGGRLMLDQDRWVSLWLLHWDSHRGRGRVCSAASEWGVAAWNH